MRFTKAQIPRLTVLIAMIMLGLLAFRPAPGENIPERLALNQAESWMADSLMGVGPKSRDRVAEQLRNNQIDNLPARTKNMVPILFNIDNTTENKVVTQPLSK